MSRNYISSHLWCQHGVAGQLNLIVVVFACVDGRGSRLHFGVGRHDYRRSVLPEVWKRSSGSLAP
jgi:hypothetical protein